MKSIGFKLVALLILFTFNINAQEVVRGVVKDKSTGDIIPNTLIKVDGTPKARTDYDGVFSLKLAPGTYVLTASNQIDGYYDVDQEVTVSAGGITGLEFLLSKSKEVQNIGPIKVTAKKVGGVASSIEAADENRKEETSTTDQMPAAQMKENGIQTASDAVRMVPGASVEDGKNVYIRGLGDRYTKSILNGMDIPGLDPDRNSVQMDIFPAVSIDNITVYKTFTPNLTGDFAGGLINIQTKDFPGRKTLYVKGGFGYNVNATFNPDFISYKGGSLDFLGFDDGTRALPISPSAKIPNAAANDPVTATYTKAFGKTMASEKSMSFLNQNHAVAIGNQINIPLKKDSLRNWTYGYNAVLNYRTNNNYFSDVRYSEYLKETDSSETRLFKNRESMGELATKNVMWTAMLGQAVKFGRNRITLVAFRTQNGTSSAANLLDENFDSNLAVLAKHGLQYTQRSISNLNLAGTHFLDSAANWKLKWNLSPTYSRISDPDIRSTAMELTNPDYETTGEDPRYIFDEAVGAEIRRIFRDLKEYNVSGKFDFEYKYEKKKDSMESKVMFGALNTYKNRTFDVNEYIFRQTGTTNQVPDDPNWFFQDENIWTVESDTGIYAVGQQEKANLYEANQNITSAYVMHVYPFNKHFEVTYGARMEKNINRYTGQNNTGTIKYENEVVLDTINVLPSVNMVYKIRKEADSVRYERSTNFRGAYTQTVARPSFREISISQIYDPIQGRRYLGNINLKQTLIHNADLRWEYFFGHTELISVSGFYKKFINPIEIVANVAAPNEFMPVNAGTADVYGAEFEVRKALIRKDSSRFRLVAGTNFTYVVSKVNMNEIETTVGGVTQTEKEVRQAFAREGEVIGDYRPMYGQSPYIINAFFTFTDDTLGLKVNFSYNVQGPKLAVIGVGLTPDVYEQPFHNLNMKVSKSFGKIHKDKGEETPRWQASLRAQNLLNFAKRQYYQSYNAYNAKDFDKNGVAKDGSNTTVPYFLYLNQGRTFSLSFTYSIR